jgi:hypothetical protein
MRTIHTVKSGDEYIEEEIVLVRSGGKFSTIRWLSKPSGGQTLKSIRQAEEFEFALIASTTTTTTTTTTTLLLRYHTIIHLETIRFFF